ncbi:FMN-binding negative transcriptional regulator [Nocardiopsis ganjiahuensis]|uniref:FMN-binding negative transcriptional regulator n=1 Tax=Nocardiopsis ganjiahuensis TaxID=239984 RepID=UPI00034B0FE3|nr:FMN-binding negative transcriptional regulator [Nocardiopsis ganjiahuensis]
MLIHPWDAAVDEGEWRGWIAEGRDFGQLAVNGFDGGPPVVVPTHAAPVSGALLVHLARPNPVWQALGDGDPVTFTVIDDYAFVPGPWRARSGTDPLDGVPTSYYSAVRFTCRAELVDDPAAKAELLTRQLAHFQPEGDHAEVTPDGPPYGRMLSGIRGLVLHVVEAAAKFKYDDHRPVALREDVADRLTGRGGRDAGAADRQRRRIKAVGPWEKRG